MLDLQDTLFILLLFSFPFTSHDLQSSWFTFRFAVGLKTLSSLRYYYIVCGPLMTLDTPKDDIIV